MSDGMEAKFVHVNLIARNWEVRARFYETVFGCVKVLPGSLNEATSYWAKQLGARCCLEKPFDAKTVLGAVAGALKRSTEGRPRRPSGRKRRSAAARSDVPVFQRLAPTTCNMTPEAPV